jgi:hypothetical protein
MPVILSHAVEVPMRYSEAVSGGPSLVARLRRRLMRELDSARETASEYLWWNSSAGRRNRDELVRLRDLYRGRRAFIFGGGPSLRRTDVRLLKNEITIGSNAIFLIFAEMGYQPTFLTVEDRLVAEDRADALNNVRGTRKIFPRDVRSFLRQDEDTLYIRFIRHYRGFPRFSRRFEESVFWGGTVTMLNLQLAYHLGCNPVYLVGFDHEYKVPEKLDSVVITSSVADENHFHPDYFGPGFRWHDPRLDRMEAGYRAAQRHFESEGRQIFNATDGGRLEVFPRVSYSTLFNQDKD